MIAGRLNTIQRNVRTKLIINENESVKVEFPHRLYRMNAELKCFANCSDRRETRVHAKNTEFFILRLSLIIFFLEPRPGILLKNKTFNKIQHEP